MLRRRIILQALVVSFAIMLAAALPVYAGDELWYKEYGGNGSDEFYDIVQLSDGGFALLGILEEPSSEEWIAWLTRTNSDGEMIWNKTYSSPSLGSELGYSLIEVSTGGYLIAGRTAAHEAWIMRTDASGVMVWNSTFKVGGAGSDAYCVIECSNGEFVVAGHSDGNFLLKLDSSGNQLWNKTFNTASAEESASSGIRSIAEVSGGHFILAGYTEGLGAGQFDVWLIRADADGNELWNRTYGGTDWDVGYSVIEVSTGGFAIAGTTRAFAWLVRVDGDGTELWNQLYGDTTGNTLSSPKSHDIVECSDGGFALTGCFYSQDIGLGHNDIWLGRTDSDGVLQWYKTFGGEFEGGDGRALVELTAGGFAVAGWIRSVESGPANGLLIVFEDSAPLSEVPDYTLLIAAGIGGIVILIVIVVYMRKRRS
ncbi:MAG: hypothetical protein KAW94_04340 [Candidatus Thorarchaeota archaeon]|nr:hypothetical protein [Candidatus Thorarchaeota archaeon]